MTDKSSKSHSSPPDSAYDGQHTLAKVIFPSSVDPFIRLLRLDRPIGTWLLAWPGLWGLAFAYHSKLGIPTPTNDQWSAPVLFGLFLLGAFLTRSAGCVFNDIADRKIDAQVARTKERPIASGALSVKTAFLILAVLLGGAALILFQLNWLTIYLGLFILVPILIYPFMKRFTYYPQAMLALCFSWGALMGWTAVKNQIEPAGLLVTLAAFAWTMGFDTIYAHQDKQDDAIIGMKSTALKFGDATKAWLIFFYTITLVSLLVAGALVGAKVIFFTSLAMASLHASWQISTLNINNPTNCLTRFRANGLFGLIIAVGICLDFAMASVMSNIW